MPLADLQRALVASLHADDPLAALERESARLEPAERDTLLAARGDGFVMTSLLVKKLRFEAIVRGDREHEREFDRDPVAFSALVCAFAREVPAREYFPADVAAAFRAWRASRGEAT